MMKRTGFDFEDEKPAAKIEWGLERIALALKTRGWRRASGKGLAPLQSQVLMLLASRMPAGMRLGELAVELSVRNATVSDVVTTLQRKGLIRKARSREDRRALSLNLTTRGVRLTRQLANEPDSLLQAVFSLDPGDQAVVLRSLMQIVHLLQQKGMIPIARMCVTCKYFRPHMYADPHRPHHCDFANAPFGDRHLRLDCSDQVPAPDSVARKARKILQTGRQFSTGFIQMGEKK